MGREGEESFEQAGAAGGRLVQGHRAAAGLGQDGQQTRSGGRLKHQVAGTHLGGEHRESAQLWRGGELVEGDLFLRAAGVGQA